MIHWHPDETTLIEYTSGNIPTAYGVCIASHLHYCDHCRSICNNLTILGATVLENETNPEEGVSDELLESTLNLLDRVPSRAPEQTNKPVLAEEYQGLPLAIRKLLAQQGKAADAWKWCWPKLRILDLAKDSQHSLSLYRIGAGGKMPTHAHRGEEITLVLDGSYSDHYGSYHQGDIVVRQKSDEHRPIASQDKDCICLVLENELPHFSGLFGKILNAAQHAFGSTKPQVS